MFGHYDVWHKRGKNARKYLPLFFPDGYFGGVVFYWVGLNATSAC